MSVIYGFGSTSDGQLGLGGIEDENVTIPQRLEFSQIVDHTDYVVTMSCGRSHTLALTNQGHLMSCGSNEFGQLGHHRSTKKFSVVSNSLIGLVIKHISCGDNHSAAVSNDGRLFLWGSNNCGQLGTSLTQSLSSEPMEVNLTDVVRVSCGSNHTLVLTKDGSFYSFGNNNYGQLGIGPALVGRNIDQPIKIKSITGIAMRHIAAGSKHSLAVSISGAVFSWGCNANGELGCGIEHSIQPFPFHLKPLRSLMIVQVYAGQQHSAVQSYQHRLLTFGAGAHGQLGHGSLDNEYIPKQVFELMGSKVTRVGCGRCHTLALVDNRKVYVFGLNALGQLGTGRRSNERLPCVLNEHFDHLVDPFNVFGGHGDHSFVAFKNDPTDVMEYLLFDSQSLLLQLNFAFLSGLFQNDDQSVQLKCLEMAFSSLQCLNSSFLKPGTDHFCANKSNHGLVMDDVMESMNLLATHHSSEKIMRVVSQSVEWRLLPSLTSNPPDVEVLRVYLILPWCSIFNDPAQFRVFHLPFAQSIVQLSSIAQKYLIFWWTDLQSRHFNRILKIFKQVVIYLLTTECDKSNTVDVAAREHTMKYCLVVMSLLNKINVHGNKVSYESFYITQLSDRIDIRKDYAAFIARRDDSRFSFCDYPFIFNAIIKTMLLQMDAHISMQMMIQETQRNNVQAMFLPFVEPVSPILHLNVSRENIVQDTIDQLSRCSSLDLKKPLKIKFKDELGDDAGGVKKEFFMILFQQILTPKYGMFDLFEDAHFIWFSFTYFEDLGEIYTLVGMLFGMALYNSVLVNIPFPLALYKKLLGRSCNLDDLSQLSQTEARSLSQLLEYEQDDFEDIFPFYFEIQVVSFDKIITVELKPDGSKIAVTKETREEYVELYVQYKLNEGINVQFDKFKFGFDKVMNSRILFFFQPQELMEMVIGNENYDWDELEKNAEYKGEFWSNHPTIRIFWQVFRELNYDQKKKFLRFLTGTDRIPLLGMKQIKIYIQPMNTGQQYYPVAHTCFNLLDLPKFESSQTLREKLLDAIEHHEGFTIA